MKFRPELAAFVMPGDGFRMGKVQGKVIGRAIMFRARHVILTLAATESRGERKVILPFTFAVKVR